MYVTLVTGSPRHGLISSRAYLVTIVTAFPVTDSQNLIDSPIECTEASSPRFAPAAVLPLPHRSL